MAGNAMDFENALDICGVDSAELMGAIQFMQGATDVDTFVAHSVKELDALGA
jgi:hypothetical protein